MGTGNIIYAFGNLGVADVGKTLSDIHSSFLPRHRGVYVEGSG